MAGYEKFREVNSRESTFPIVVAKDYLTEHILIHTSLYLANFRFTSYSLWNVSYVLLKLLLDSCTLTLGKNAFTLDE